MKSHVRNMVRECDICQRNKHESVSSPGLLEPLPIPEKVWEDVTMDFIEKLPLSKGKDAVMVVVDRCSKFTHFIALITPIYSSKGGSTLP